MNTLVLARLDVQFAAILKHVQSIQRLNLAVETERQEILQESRRLLGEIAWYRHQLERTVHVGAASLRCAA